MLGVTMEIYGKNNFIQPGNQRELKDMIWRLLAEKVMEERFDHWGGLSFSPAISRIISLSLINKIGEN